MELRDFWGLAEVHCQSFYPRAGWPFASFLRLDRVVAMQARARSSQRLPYGFLYGQGSWRARTVL